MIKRTALKRSTKRVSPVSKSATRAEEVKCDKLWSEYVNVRFNGRCARCNAVASDPHHCVPRRVLATRWMPHNGVLLCRKCHDVAETHPSMFKAWLMGHKYLSERYVQALAASKAKLSALDIAELRRYTLASLPQLTKAIKMVS